MPPDVSSTPPSVGRVPKPREGLYTAAELYDRFDAHGWESTLDSQLADMYRAALPEDAPAFAVHDATITMVLDAFVAGREMVGVMGGHKLQRGEAAFEDLIDLGSALTEAQFTVVTGGGPGAMEAANFGAWVSAFDEETRGRFRSLLRDAPQFLEDRDAAIAAALKVISEAPHSGAVNLGIPTWVYWHEPPNVFATSIAKYFNNSIREQGLLSVATSGVIFARGGPGTWQEIMTDAAQNSYLTEGVRSPMVFLRYDRDDLKLVVEQARAFGWEELVIQVDEVDAAVQALLAYRSAAPEPKPLHRPQRIRS